MDKILLNAAITSLINREDKRFVSLAKTLISFVDQIPTTSNSLTIKTPSCGSSSPKQKGLKDLGEIQLPEDEKEQKTYSFNTKEPFRIGHYKIKKSRQSQNKIKKIFITNYKETEIWSEVDDERSYILSYDENGPIALFEVTYQVREFNLLIVRLIKKSPIETPIKNSEQNPN
ncbi:MAG: hypothetical protein ACRCXZ_10405 [Patescibacteria group bacterium]